MLNEICKINKLKEEKNQVIILDFGELLHFNNLYH